MADTWHGARAGIPDPWTLPLDTFDVSKAAIFQQNAHGEYFRRLRKEAPVHYCPESQFGGYWSITRFNDIVAIDSNHKQFSSQNSAPGFLSTAHDWHKFLSLAERIRLTLKIVP
ncbi:MAG: hypothetical protein MUE84_16455, partial [Hyphomonas sp.]|nr:hypothetical protein [Hyphomonas sp.]